MMKCVLLAVVATTAGVVFDELELLVELLGTVGLVGEALPPEPFSVLAAEDEAVPAELEPPEPVEALLPAAGAVEVADVLAAPL